MGRDRQGAKSDGALTPYGFSWGPLTVERAAAIAREPARPERRYRILTLRTAGRELYIYVSPTGRSVRVYENGKELR